MKKYREFCTELFYAIIQPIHHLAILPLGVLLVIKTVEDEWYVVIKAYKLTVFEVLRDYFVLSYIVCLHYPYIQSLLTQR